MIIRKNALILKEADCIIFINAFYHKTSSLSGGKNYLVRRDACFYSCNAEPHPGLLRLYPLCSNLRFPFPTLVRSLFMKFSAVSFLLSPQIRVSELLGCIVSCYHIGVVHMGFGYAKFVSLPRSDESPSFLDHRKAFSHL